MSIIDDAAAKGAKVVLDGRTVSVPGYEKGNFLGPTILDNVKPGNPGYDEEIFGPVCSFALACLPACLPACSCTDSCRW